MDVHPYLKQALEVASWLSLLKPRRVLQISILQSLMDKRDWSVLTKALWCIDDYDFSAERFFIGLRRFLRLAMFQSHRLFLHGQILSEQ